MFNEKIGMHQKQRLILFLEYFCCFVWIIVYSLNDPASHVVMMTYILAVLVSLILLIIMLYISKTNDISVLFVSKNKSIITSAFTKEAENFKFHSEIYDKETDSPYYIVTDSNLKTYRIKIVHQQNKWYLILERIEEIMEENSQISD